MQLEPLSCRAVGWGGVTAPPTFACSQSPSFFKVWSQGDPRDSSDQGPEGMLSKPYTRVTGKFSLKRPVLVVVMSVSTTRQAGPEESVCLSLILLSAMLSLSLGMCLQTLHKGLTTPMSLDWSDLDLVFQFPSLVPCLIS